MIDMPPKGFMVDPTNPHFWIREDATAVKLRELEDKLAALKTTQEVAEVIRANMQEEIAHLRKQVEEWRQCAAVEAGLRRDFLARTEKAETENEQLRLALEKIR